MNFDKYTSSKIFSFFDILFVLVSLNVFWLLTSVVGLGIFTFMPATLTLFIMVMNYLKGYQTSLFQTLLRMFKYEYIKSQVIFIILVLAGLIIYLNIQFFSGMVNGDNVIIGYIGLVINFMVLIGYIITWIHLFPVYLFYPLLNPFQIIKYSFLFGMAFPLTTFLIIIIIALNTYITIFHLPFILVLGWGSISAFVIIKLLRHRYEKLIKDFKPIHIK